MHLQIPHKFSKAQALDRVRQGLIQARPHMKGQVEMEEERWDGDTLNFAFVVQKKRITGTLVVQDREFVIDATLPLMWRIFEKRIESTIMEQVQGML